MEGVLIRHENGSPANRQRLAALATAVVVVLAGIVAATVVGPGKAIDLLVNYLVPVGVITGVIIAALALLVWAVKRLPNPPYRDWWQ
jgi:protein-S-isoprenylcysteine O-methyltransferase Ste14